jgi:hypothetical protein
MVTRGKSPEVLAYAAGVVDGEGHIGMYRNIPKASWKGRTKSPRYEYGVTVVNTVRPLLYWLHAEFGGSVCARPPQKEGWQPQWRWYLASLQAADFCRAILPYLRVKQEQATLLVAFVDTKTTQRGAPGRRSSDEELSWRDGIYLRLCALNRTYPQRLSERTPG